MIKVYGDSWAYGSELNMPKEQPFVHHLAQGREYVNRGVPGSSLGQITYEIINSDIQKEDFVIVVTPPDTRWYTENEGAIWSLAIIGSRDSIATAKEPFDGWKKEMLHYYDTAHKKVIWFSYHYSLFIFTLQEYFTKIGCKFLFMHNYGKLDLYRNIGLQIDRKNFLHHEYSLTALLNGKDEDLIKRGLDGPTDEMFSGKYFKGCINHPNELGHKRIAQLIYNNNSYKQWLTSTTNTASSKRLL